MLLLITITQTLGLLLSAPSGPLRSAIWSLDCVRASSACSSFSLTSCSSPTRYLLSPSNYTMKHCKAHKGVRVSLPCVVDWYTSTDYSSPYPLACFRVLLLPTRPLSITDTRLSSLSHRYRVPVARRYLLQVLSNPSPKKNSYNNRS